MVEMHRDAHALALDGLDQRTEVAVAGKQHHVVDVIGHFHGVHGELDVHVALDLAAAKRVNKFLGGLGDDRIAIVIEPVDQRADRGILLILNQGRVIKGAQQATLGLKLFQEALVVNVEAE